MSDQFERVFGGDCPVCSHSHRGAHDIFGRCQVCGINCATHPWPYASIRRYCDASDATEVAIPRCGLCGHRAHGDGPCGCMDLGPLADGRLAFSCVCWPEIMPHPGQREMFVARRMLALARPAQPNRYTAVTIPLWAPKVELWRHDRRNGMVRLGSLHNERVLGAITHGRTLSVEVKVDPSVEERWRAQEAMLLSMIGDPPELGRLRTIDLHPVVLYLALVAAVVLPAVIIAAALGLL